MLEACGCEPYTGRELPDLRNRFLPQHRPTNRASGQTRGPEIFSWKHNHERRSWSRPKYFWAKKCRSKAQSNDFGASHHTLIRSSFLQQQLVYCKRSGFTGLWFNREGTNTIYCVKIGTPKLETNFLSNSKRNTVFCNYWGKKMVFFFFRMVVFYLLFCLLFVCLSLFLFTIL